METSEHRIRRQHWQVSALTTEEAFQLRKQIRERLSDTLLPVFERSFDALASHDSVIHLPKLEIKLKISSTDDLWEVLPKELYEQLNQQLKFLTGNQESQRVASTFAEKSTRQNRVEILLHYLQGGSLLWYFSEKSSDESALELQQTIRDNRKELLTYLEHHRPSEPFCFRFFQLLTPIETDELIEQLFSTLTPRWSEDYKVFLLILVHLNDARFSQNTRLKLLARLVSNALVKAGQNLLPDLPAEVIPILTPSELKAFQNYIHSIPSVTSSFYKKEDARWPNKTEKETHRKTSADNLLNGQTSPNFTDLYNGIPETTKESLFIPDFKPQVSPRLKVQYAGLVLLFPYIQRIFVQCGIIEEGDKEISTSKIPVAAALLHYLATGSVKIYEFELSFIKLLLGMEQDDYLPISEGLLSQDQHEEVESLLLSVIHHWSILKNTSVEGLRSAFLRRSGMLQKTEEGVLLQLESSPIDLLLDHLPWSFTIFKLPWMKKPVYTEWQTR